MKKILLVLFLGVSVVKINAQSCTPGANYADSTYGVWPDTVINFPFATVSNPYSTDLNFKVPSTITADLDPTVAGVVSAQPSYIMNAGQQGEHVTMVALTGRVPVKVVGTVTKGAMMVSAGNGRARAEANPEMGTVIGKALKAFNGSEGVIEVVVGRL